MTNRKKPEVRSPEIIAAGLVLAEKNGFQNVTRDQLAEAVKCSAANISYHFGTMAAFRADCMRAAIKQRNLPVIAQGMAVNFPQCRRLSDELRNAAADSLKG